MFNKVCFFNHFHNGDIHLSRSFVRYMTEKFTSNGIKCFYFHNNYIDLLSDIPNLNHIKSCNITNEKLLSHQDKDVLYISTWYGADSIRYLNTYGLTYNCLYHIFEGHCKNYLNELLPTTDSAGTFFPSIDYDKFYIKNINNWLKNNTGKKVLISNGKTLSGQVTKEINFYEVIDFLSNSFTDITFIVSNNENVPIKDNVIIASDIIKKPIVGDLNEISYISTFCDVIMGACSGAYTFAVTKQNIFDSEKTFVSFSNLGELGSIWYKSDDFRLNYKCKIIYSNTNDIALVNDIAYKAIKERIYG